MSLPKFAVVAGAAFIAGVAAHGRVQGITADGVWYDGYNPSFQYAQVAPIVAGWSDPADLSNGFVAPDAYGTPDIICHLSATNAKGYVNVTAGSEVNLEWSAWPASHHGPVLDYLAACPGDDCTTVDKTKLKFFKIDGVGLIDDTTVPGTWASDKLIANNNSWSVTIPSSLAPGAYVLRHEIIALHSAEQDNGAQNYPQCVNLRVSGTGTAVPASADTKLGTALYKASEPGIKINIYTSLASYVVPGPAPWAAAAASGASTGAAVIASPSSPSAETTPAALPSTPASSPATIAYSPPPIFPSSNVTSAGASASASASAPAVTGGSGIITDIITDYITVTDYVVVTVTV
ncbi:hypothetical protein DSL72_007678 [Monilinia vaccinii-corymbosi]|uniref:Auxiliary Activity family 9 catalytic domain-containing protein n=1 Tax=Monilinia vaccinii-corymbosi TaxID=61207 RepID=A0A8A3PIF8_9HELO|nr:hypothetical protein DSL72_007678 [Monilinia vaccinii-corymbosi]